MKQVINCRKEHNPLINKKLKKVSVEEGLTIATELFAILNKRRDGIGLAANQVGIDASVAVVNVRKPIILINPEIVDTWDEIPYYEGCLSYKGKGIQTKRFNEVQQLKKNVFDQEMVNYKKKFENEYGAQLQDSKKTKQLLDFGVTVVKTANGINAFDAIPGPLLIIKLLAIIFCLRF